ncbi:sensor histidine kinase domain protein [Burkholderia pseudomallei]|nr:sensor histidine kinase domain protein [Burkholderia pseudomallei]KOS77390.1 sensor histidine kinase domain protein [Burkholderia mallei]
MISREVFIAGSLLFGSLGSTMRSVPEAKLANPPFFLHVRFRFAWQSRATPFTRTRA